MLHKKKRKQDDLDTETTFADMNVEGFRWYDPRKKDGKEPISLSREETRAMIRGAVAALWPVLLGAVAVLLLLAGLAYLWLS